MTTDSNKGHSATAQRVLQKIADRIAGGENFGLLEEEQLALLRLTHELDHYRYELEEVQGELESKEEQLRKLSRDLETAGAELFDYLNFIPVAFVRLSKKGIIERVNSAARQMLVGSEHPPIGAPFSNFVKSEDQHIYFDGLKNITATGRLTSFQMRIIGPTDKKEIHTHIQVEPKIDPTGRFSHWHLALFDVSEARLKNLRLQEVHEQLQLAAQAAELGVWNYDLARGTSKWNTQLYRLLGLEPREGPEDAERFFEFIHPEDRAGSVASITTIINSTEDHIEEEFRIVRADGKIRWLAARGRIYRDENGRKTRISGINYDITERKDAEVAVRLAQLQLAMQLAETERANEELSQYAYAISHDLKEPMRTIRNYSDLHLQIFPPMWQKILQFSPKKGFGGIAAFMKPLECRWVQIGCEDRSVGFDGNQQYRAMGPVGHVFVGRVLEVGHDDSLAMMTHNEKIEPLGDPGNGLRLVFTVDHEKVEVVQSIPVAEPAQLLPDVRFLDPGQPGHHHVRLAGAGIIDHDDRKRGIEKGLQFHGFIDDRPFVRLTGK